MEDDPRSLNEIPDRPLRPDEHPVGRALGPEDCVVVDPLGHSKKFWDQAKHDLFAQYGDEITKDLKLPRMLVTVELSSYEYLQRSMKACVDVCENDALAADERMDAAEVLGYLADISARKAKILLDIADKAQKVKADKTKRNLPPNAIVQVNVEGAAAVKVAEKQVTLPPKVAPKQAMMGPQSGS